MSAHNLQTDGPHTDVVIGLASEFSPSTAKKVDVNGHVIAVVRIEDDFYAIGDVCSHADFSLSEGTVWTDECELECWKHGATFSLRTGEPLSLPATVPVPVYAIRRNGDDIIVSVPQ